MKIKYIEEEIESKYDGSDENLIYYCKYFCDESLEDILNLYLNRIFENSRAKDLEKIIMNPINQTSKKHFLITK